MIVGIDIGGTKTHVLIQEADSERHVVVPSSQWCVNGLFGDDLNAERLVGIFSHHVEHSRAVPLVVGAHGCDTAAQCREFESRLSRAYPGPLSVHNDAELLVPAAGLDTGIAVIVGTGSIIVGSNTERETVVAGGYGWLLGDPGSAPGLAREAVRKIMAAKDQGLPIDALGARFMDRFKVDHEVDLAYAFSAARELTSWGELAPQVFEAADAGSRLALEVIDEAAAALALSVHQVRARGAIGSDVVCAGGVVTNQPRLFTAIREHISLLDPNLAVQLLREPPVRGAVAIARKIPASHHPTSNHGGNDEVH